MNDIISRQAAITAIQNAYCDTEGGEDKCAVWKNVGLTNALHIIQDLPSAQPERKKGKWTKISPASIYECSVCGQTVMTDDIEAYSYCHGCGVKMEVSE